MQTIRTARRTRVTLPTRAPRRPDRVDADGAHLAGTALVAGVPRSVGAAARGRCGSTGSRPGRSRTCSSAPRSTRRSRPSAPIVLTFSRPGRRHPRARCVRCFRPHVSRRVAPAERPHARLPAGRARLPARPSRAPAAAAADRRDLGQRPGAVHQTLTWQVPRGSLLRMSQMLADLGYLPLRFTGDGVPPTAGGSDSRGRRAARRAPSSGGTTKTPRPLKGALGVGSRPSRR